jgi:hypothetical protein
MVNNPDSKDGFGDWQCGVEYRIAAANEEDGNHIVTAFYPMSFPIGHYQQGALRPIITPYSVLGRFYLGDRPGVTVGGELEIAATSVHPASHIPRFLAAFPLLTSGAIV